ncbi:MAG TPA: hypothetical protein VGQ36_20800 [Thermoanaerobaculia bacterium]|jgi:hypothetical protein|nr:hypothetical protein [Thermoanaerobaculia bacterium]
MSPEQVHLEHPRTTDRVAIRYGTIFILLHGAVALLHEAAHRILPVGLPTLKYAIAYAFVGVLPIVAMVLLWTSRRRMGIWLLLISMAGSLVYAGAHHFVMNNPDHINQVPRGAWLPVFQVTAVVMLILEAFGCWLSVWLLARTKDATVPA